MADLVPMESITGKILLLRGMKAMLDRACLVDVEHVYDRTIVNAIRDGVEVATENAGSQLAGSILRVAERGALGGHDIPATDIERHFPRSLRNLLNEFSKRVDSCLCYMNDQATPVLVFEQHGDTRIIERDDYYQLFIKEAEK